MNNNVKDSVYMKNKFFRISSLLVVIAMLFTLIGSNIVFADSVDYSGSLNRMQDLGIISSSATNLNSVVTRSQFLESIVASEGLNTTAANSKGSTEFSDISANSTLSGYINAGLSIGAKQGVNEGVVYGTANGTYKPNSAVTYAEACTIMVRLLGYSDTDSELQSASWPNNYIQEAATLDLTTDISLSKFSNLTVGVEAVLFDRLFDSLMKTTTGTDKFFSDNYYADTTVTGTLEEAIIYGNSKTSDVSTATADQGKSLSDNEILTSIGTLTLDNGVTTPDLGGKYELYVDGTTVTKVTIKENTLENYPVKSVSTDGIISYTDANNKIQTMTLPQASAYYYHGAFIDYDTAVKSVQSYSSIILAKNSNGDGYEYGIIVDPNFGEPYVYNYDNVDLLNKLKDTKYDYMYRETDTTNQSNLSVGNITTADLTTNEVLYFVSDIWGDNTFVYVYDKTVYGTIASFLPNKLNPTSLTIGSTTSTPIYFSPYFDKTELTNYDGNIANFLTNTNVGDYRAFVLGVDGKIVDIYIP
jgi:hypothetical protein